MKRGKRNEGKESRKRKRGTITKRRGIRRNYQKTDEAKNQIRGKIKK